MTDALEALHYLRDEFEGMPVEFGRHDALRLAFRTIEAALEREASPERRAFVGCDLITAERKRQVETEGWTKEHDDAHSRGELVKAAICYASYSPTGERDFVDLWPWERKSWKPTGDRLRNLVKAGALIAAEIDRLRRAGEVKA